MADVRFICPKCGHVYEFAAHMAGKRGRCKSCQSIFHIPAPPPVIGPSIASERSSSTRPAPASPPPDRTSTPPAAAPAPAAQARPAGTGGGSASDVGKVIFNCPSCGHGYRLDAKLAGKQGRCTVCRGVFTIPARSGPVAAVAAPAPAPAAPPRPAPAVAPVAVPAPAPVAPRPAAAAPIPASRAAAPRSAPAMAGVAAGDSGWWELDSSEAIPVPPAAAAVGGRRSPAAAVPAATDWATLEDSDAEDDEPVGRVGTRPAAQPAASPNRRKWVMAGALAAGIGVGSVMFVVMYNLVSGTVHSTMDPEGKLEPKEEPAPPTVAASTDETPPPAAVPSAAPTAAPSPAASRHRETVDDLVRAYNQIADGYARVRDTNSIAAGRALVARGAVQLRASAHRGKTLPELSPAERKALIQQSGPELIRAIDRVLVELRRLQTTDGIRSDFGRLIDAYTRSREQVQREVDAA